MIEDDQEVKITLTRVECETITRALSYIRRELNINPIRDDFDNVDDVATKDYDDHLFDVSCKINIAIMTQIGARKER